MRIVEYEKHATSFNYRALKGIGVVAGIFATVVCVLMIANNLSIKRTDPIHSPALLKLLEELKTNPQDQALREEIRELDLIARRAFFTSQQFNRMAIYLLLGSLIVMVVAFKSLTAFKQTYPYPDSREPKEDLIENAKWARKSVTVAGFILLGAALMLALPWKSPLDEQEALKNSTAKIPKQPEPSEAPLPYFPSREELLQNWPSFRGADNGVVAEKPIPISWNVETGEGIAWKTAIPNPGLSSPIIWGNRVFLSGANKDVREVYCLDAETGEMLWRKPLSNIPGSPAPSELPRVDSETGYAASTMATDGVRAFAIFSTGDVAAFDFEGNQIWGRNLGVPRNAYGHASSLAVFEDLLLVQYDQEEEGAFLGLDAATGNTRWSTPRDLGASWTSPILTNIGDHVEVILAAGAWIVSYDPKSGIELWRVEGIKGAEMAASPVYSDGILYIAADYMRFIAVEIVSHQILWENLDTIPGISTPVVSDGLLFYGLGYGGFGCFDAKTGEQLWHEETDEGFYASPILIGDRVYLMDRSGMMHIFKAGKTYEPLGSPTLNELSLCTPAIAGDSLYYRGTEHLFKIRS